MSKLLVERVTLDVQVPKVFEPLFRNGYQYQKAKIDSTPALGAYVEAFFHNAELSRSLRVCYLPPCPPHPDALLVHIDNGATDSFAIGNFLRHIEAPTTDVEVIKLGNYQGDFPTRLSACLTAVKGVLDKHLEPVISGKEWKHVPINWMGLK
jgi:hypothetical protein